MNLTKVRRTLKAALNAWREADAPSKRPPLELAWETIPDAQREQRGHVIHTTFVGEFMVVVQDAGENDWAWTISDEDAFPVHMRCGFATADLAKRHVEGFLSSQIGV